MVTQIYEAQVELLLQTLPLLNNIECFALKGGTAINLFFRDMPRLSVGIDLAYLPFDNRELSFEKINQALKQLSKTIEKSINAKVLLQLSEQKIGKIQVSTSNAQIIIEPNYIMLQT